MRIKEVIQVVWIFVSYLCVLRFVIACDMANTAKDKALLLPGDVEFSQTEITNAGSHASAVCPANTLLIGGACACEAGYVSAGFRNGTGADADWMCQCEPTYRLSYSEAMYRLTTTAQAFCMGPLK